MVLSEGLAAVGSLAASFMSNASSKKQQARAYNYARLLQQQQYDLGIRGYKEAPSAQRQGLTDAGYNPMLALGNVGNGVNVSGGTPVSANATDVSGIRDSISQAIQLRNQTEQTEATADAAYADADLKKAQKASELERLPFVSKREKAEYQKTAMETAKLENDIHYQNEYLNYLSNSLDVQQKVAEISANAQKYGIDKPLEITRDKDKRYKEWGEQHPYLRNVDETFTRYFNGFGYNASSASSTIMKR